MKSIGVNAYCGSIESDDIKEIDAIFEELQGQDLEVNITKGVDHKFKIEFTRK